MPDHTWATGELETELWVCSSPRASCALLKEREFRVSGERLAVQRGNHRPRDAATCSTASRTKPRDVPHQRAARCIHWVLCPRVPFLLSQEYILEERVAKKGVLDVPLPKRKEENGRHSLASSFCPAASFPLPPKLLGMSLKSNAMVTDP